ncbi:MAG: 4-alpha-glucanotransferase [Chloroflexi bacterium]|nr:4-alpha-glucanotransferase [Chloroflexota bacterium]
MPLDRRRSGVLLHPTSLPSRYGIGDLGPAAFDFLEYLKGARQTLWQVLPLGPTGFGDSPYASPSAFAGNPLLIAPEPLVEDDLLDATDLDELAQLPCDHVEFGVLAPLKQGVLHKAFQRARDRAELRERIEAFRCSHAEWIDDYALFSALNEHFNCLWSGWAAAVRDREPDAMARARDELSERIQFFVFCQFLFFEQWTTLRRRANAFDIHIVGDIPIFVAYDSADVWAHRRLFKLDEQGQPRVVAGVPPDYFSATGQLWGNPLYDWDAMAANGYAWWIARFRHLAELVDLLRIDHFRGFEAAWEVPAEMQTAVGGSWVRGPGTAVFDAIGKDVPVIAEDLGLITDEVRALLQQTGFPGMKVLQFAFGDDARNPYMPHNYDSPNCVVYTGTHDNDTTLGWFAHCSDQERRSALRYVGSDGSDMAFDLMRAALGSVARTAIVPLQDVLGLGSEARMNTPGASLGNWSWRVCADQLDPQCANRLGHLTETYGRA